MPGRTTTQTGCRKNHLENMPGVVDEEFCGHCGGDLGVKPVEK